LLSSTIVADGDMEKERGDDPTDANNKPENRDVGVAFLMGCKLDKAVFCSPQKGYNGVGEPFATLGCLFDQMNNTCSAKITPTLEHPCMTPICHDALADMLRNHPGFICAREIRRSGCGLNITDRRVIWQRDQDKDRQRAANPKIASPVDKSRGYFLLEIVDCLIKKNITSFPRCEAFLMNITARICTRDTMYHCRNNTATDTVRCMRGWPRNNLTSLCQERMGGLPTVAGQSVFSGAPHHLAVRQFATGTSESNVIGSYYGFDNFDSIANDGANTPTPTTPPNIGAIVGGIVGGVAAVALIGMFIRRNNSNKGRNTQKAGVTMA